MPRRRGAPELRDGGALSEMGIESRGGFAEGMGGTGAEGCAGRSAGGFEGAAGAMKFRFEGGSIMISRIGAASSSAATRDSG